jgi:hypothetical protein
MPFEGCYPVFLFEDKDLYHCLKDPDIRAGGDCQDRPEENRMSAPTADRAFLDFSSDLS